MQRVIFLHECTWSASALMAAQIAFFLRTSSLLSEEESRRPRGLFLRGNASLAGRNTAQWRTLWGNHRVFIEGCEVGAEGPSRGREHVLVLVFSFCVTASSKRLNHTSVSCNEMIAAPNPPTLHPYCLLQLSSQIPWHKKTDERKAILTLRDKVWIHTDTQESK